MKHFFGRIWNPVFAILMSWLYNRTHGSVLAPAMFHAAMNAFGNQFSITSAGNVMFIGLAIVVIVYDKMWKKLPSDHPAVCRSPEHAAQPSVEPTSPLAP